jgi:hypothetical protein
VYEQLMAIETGFEQAARGLGALRKSAGFDESEIERLRDLIAETRAATLSYLTNVIETAETDEAARLQGRRVKRERREES